MSWDFNSRRSDIAAVLFDLRHTVLRLFLLLAVAASGCDENSGDDLVTLRDGTSKGGKLERCDLSGCTLSGAAIARQMIQSIRLGRQSVLRLKDPSRDEVHLTDASVVAETMTSVETSEVTTNLESHPRDRLAWIYLAPRPPLRQQRWHGDLDWSAHNVVQPGPQDWSGHVDLALDDDGSGALTGTLVGTQTQKLGLA